ncbi:hypothetical protein C0J52_05710 [Blattella germanica]|nr:hypothetical protein C0J52_05710 [Blattella germanica]
MNCSRIGLFTPIIYHYCLISFLIISWNEIGNFVSVIFKHFKIINIRALLMRRGFVFSQIPES